MQVELVAVAVLKDVGSTLALVVVEVVGLIEVVPVDLTETLIILPQVGVECLGRFVVVVRREVAVVVGTRVGGVIPVECRRSVERLAEAHAGIYHSAALRLPYPVDDSRGVKRLNHLRAALLAVLPAPCRVVEIVVGEYARLLKHGVGVGAACGSTKSGERDRVLVVEHLLQRQEVSGRVVERTVLHTLVGIACYCAHGECPAALAESGRVESHSAHVIVAVGVSHVGTEARSEVLGLGVDIGCTSHRTYGKCGCVESDTGAFILESLVESAKH